jgi:hypothetical protein
MQCSGIEDLQATIILDFTLLHSGYLLFQPIIYCTNVLGCLPLRCTQTGEKMQSNATENWQTILSQRHINMSAQRLGGRFQLI